MLKTHGRYGYTPITRRSEARWPSGARLAVYFALGVEEYVFGEGLTADIIPGIPQPDLTNASWRDYGNRVAGFRLLDRFASLDVPLAILLNTAVYDHAPELMAALHAAGCEMVAHGITNSDTLAGRSEEDERAYLRRVRDRIAAEGRPPLGWSSPWLAQTANTIDLLAEAGYGYVLDLAADDRPIWLAARSGRLLHIPYALEINDDATIMGRYAGAAEFADMVIGQFEELLDAARAQPLVMPVVIHSFISGQPFRLRELTRALRHIVARRGDIWLTTPGRICEAVMASPDLAV